MRPQHITAENDEGAGGRGSDGGRFNEAAAYHCGKPTDLIAARVEEAWLQ